MNNKLFYILHGNNGATYIFNTKSIRDCIESVQFYKALTLKSNIQKKVLCLFLIIAGKLKFSILKTVPEIEDFLQSISNNIVHCHIADDMSIHIAPTRDKIIINKHGHHFQKIAFGGSYPKVKQEATIYSLFSKQPVSFLVSEFSDFVDVENSYCSFVLKNKKTKKHVAKQHINLSVILSEFFTYSGHQSISLKDYIHTELLSKNILLPHHVEILNRIVTENGNKSITLGLTHRDFKPWNVKLFNKLLIFDFEETITNGVPLEDMLNYIVDPIIRYKDLHQVKTEIFKPENVTMYNLYLQQLHLTVDYRTLIELYVINRYIFWEQPPNNEHTAELFSELTKLVV